MSKLRNFLIRVASVVLLLLSFTGVSLAGSNGGLICFVQYGGTGNGSSANKPYGSLQQVENDSKCMIINVLQGMSPLDGGITLKDGQLLIGLGKGQPTITNTLNAGNLQAGPVIRLANNSAVINLNVLALSIGVLGDNVTGVLLSDLLITKALSYPRSAKVDTNLCDLTNAIYRGCSPTGVRNDNDGIQLLADDLGSNKNFLYLLNDIIIKDIPDSQRWADGVFVVGAGNNTKVNVILNDVHIENVGRGYQFVAYNTSKLMPTVVNSSSKNSNNDGLDALTSFFRAICPNCPTSDPTLILNVNGFSATPQPAGGNEGQGIETFSFEPNKGTHEIHIANTSLTGFSVGFFVWNLNGYPKSVIYDLGCLNPNSSTVVNRAACIAAGYTSLGNNRIFGNNAFVAFDPGYNPGLEILTDGQANVLAQNNYWGPYSTDRITVLVNGVRRCGAEFDAIGNLIRDVPPYRCEINQGNPTTGFGTINDDFPRH